MVEFEWDDANERHLSRHGIGRQEAEDAMNRSPLAFSLVYRNGEQRATYLAKTASGRLLHLVTTLRGQRIRIITAYPAPRAMKAFYAKFHKEDK